MRNLRLLLRNVLLVSGAAVLFGTGCGPESPAPSTVTLAEGAATNPTVAVDAVAGTSYVAWVERDTAGANAYLSRWEADEAPATPVRVNHIPGDAYVHAQAPTQVAVGPDGAVYVAWVNSREVEGRRFPATDLRFTHSVDGGQTFAPAVTVNDDTGGVPAGHSFHDLAVGPDGTVYVAWLDSRRSARGQVEGELSGTDLRVARSTDGGRSFDSVVVAEGTCECCRAALAVDAKGAVYVAWRHLFGPDVRDMAVARSADGGRTFTAPARVHRDGWQIAACPHSGPSVQADDTGRVHAAWYTGAEERVGLYYAVSTDGARHFDAPVPLISGGSVAQARVASGGAGTWLAYEDRRADRVVLVRSGTGGIQEVARFEGRLPALAAAPGDVVVAWKGSDGVQAHRRAIQ